MKPKVRCTNLKGLLSTERAAIRCHLDTHVVAGEVVDRCEVIHAFIENHGGLMRELYCAHVCPDRGHCEAIHLSRMDRNLLLEQTG